jgi:hypothetical protein
MNTKRILGILAILSLVFVAACGEGGEDGAPHGRGVQFFMSYGTEFHGDSGLDCGECHGAAFANCTYCHFGPSGARVPDGVAWTHGTVPHNDPALTAVSDACNRCHNYTRKYDNVPATCHNCH